jgi:hypothetical protein
LSLRDYLAHYGISPKDFPPIAGKYSGGIVVCGDAACIWEDLLGFGCAHSNGIVKHGWDFLTVNRLIEVFPGRVDHCYSNVGAVLLRHVHCRRDEYRIEWGSPLNTHSRTDGTQWIWPWNGGGTSGLGAVLTALALGYERVVLAGMPLDNGPHNGEPPWRVTRFTTEVGPGDQYWQLACDMAFNGKVKSLSGRTRDWLGSP